MYIYNNIILLLFGLLIFCPLVFAGGVSRLSEIYDTPVPAEIRRNFDEYIHARETCPECEQGVINGEKFINIYTKKFLVIGLEPNSFGGVWAIIAVEGELRQVFRLWLYDIGHDAYDLRSVAELTGSFDEEFADELCGPEYSHFWL